MMENYTKAIKRELRELNSLAYEQELSLALGRLHHDFQAWESGQIGASELSDRIHKYYTGPSRELHKRYSNALEDLNVAYALVTGLLEESAASPQLREAISHRVRYVEKLKIEGNLILPE